MKRVAAPGHWMLDKMGGNWAPRPSTGPHKLRECIPLILLLRNRLKYALNGREVITICMNRLVTVDNKVRTDHKFPCGFMDVVSIKKSKDLFRLLYDTKGRYVLNRVTKQEAKFKLCKVTKRYVGLKKVPMMTTHDGRTIRYPDPLIKVNDSIKLNLETGKVEKVLKFDVGCTVMITKGRNCGRVGTLVHRERHLGGFDIIHVKDAAQHVFATRLNAAFVIGEGGESEVELLRRKGVKLSIIEERAIMMKKTKR